MRDFRLIILSLIAAVLAACIDITDPDQVKDQPTDQLCEDYYFGQHPSTGTSTDWPTKQKDIKKELDKRHAVAPADWALIDQGHIEMGMGECALKASWGFPLRVTRSITAAGNAAHYTYTPTRYADVTDGKVTGFRY
jgi:hypothetical protein